jgi:hypothetical protein
MSDDYNEKPIPTVTSIGAQPLDSDLTSIAALSTTSYGRAFLALADAAALKTVVDAASVVAGTVTNGVYTTTSKPIIQTVVTETGAVATGTTVMVLDDTIPQNTEGDEYMTRAVTPTSASNILEIEVSFFATNDSSSNKWIMAALFQDSIANALAANLQWSTATALTGNQVIIRYRMVAGTTSAITFKVRGGFNVAGTTTFNGAAGGRLLGGVMNSFIRVREIQV